MGRAAFGLTLAVTLGVGWILGVSPAHAAPTTYGFVGGDATVTSDTIPSGTSILASSVLLLDGTFVEFDDVLPELADFEFSLAPTGLLSITPYGGYDMFQLHSVLVIPGAGYTNYSASSTGPGQYSFAVGPVDVAAVYSASDSTLVNAPTGMQPLSFTNGSISGTIDVVTGEIDLMGITLGIIDGTPFNEEDMLVKADIFFEGAVVPEARLDLLLVLGFSFLLLKRRTTADVPIRA